MIKYKDIINAIKTNIDATRSVSILFTVNTTPHRIHILVSQPDDFNNYQDVIARVTLTQDGNVLWDTLLTHDTDLNHFIDKLNKKVEVLKR